MNLYFMLRKRGRVWRRPVEKGLDFEQVWEAGWPHDRG